MNRDEIMKILPHRDQMLLLDEVENRDGTSVGHYTVRGDEFFLQGHFPGHPIVPGSHSLRDFGTVCLRFDAGCDAGRQTPCVYGAQ